MTKMQESIYRTDRIWPFPSSTQEFMQIYGMSRDGICQLEKKPQGADVTFDKAYAFLDTNFATMNDAEKDELIAQYSVLLAGLSAQFKILTISNSIDADRIRREICINTPSQMDALADSFNHYIEKSLTEGCSGLEQTHLFVISCKRKDLLHARDFFRSIEGNLRENFRSLQSALVPLDAAGRLKYLAEYYCLGDIPRPEEEIREYLQSGRDWKDLVSPGVIRNWQDEYGTFDGMTLQMDEKYMRVLHLPRFPNGINPDIMRRLMGCRLACCVTIDVSPIPQTVARKYLDDVYMMIGRTIEKQQETRNRAGAFSSDVSYEARHQRDVVEGIKDILNDNNESLYYAGVYALISAESKKELDNACMTFTQAAEGEGFVFRPVMFNQMDAFLTAGPTGSRFCFTMQPILTQPLAGMTPFIVHELYDAGGIVYGINQVSGNVLVGDRRNLINGNGFIIGSSGGGKGIMTKIIIIQIVKKLLGKLIIVVPGPEYRAPCEYLGGTYIDFSVESDNHINPLSIDNYEYAENKTAFLKDKTNLMLSIFSQIKGNNITPQDNSLIGRVITLIYEGLGKKGFKEPTLVEFYQTMKMQPEERAQDLALSMELFVNGPMNMFAKHTNIKVSNDLVVYAMEGMDRSQSGIGVTIMLENIRSEFAKNAKNGDPTYLFVDEAHELTHSPYSAAILEKIWREVRKLGGFCTAITQNVADLVANPAAEAMLCNSEFLILYNLKEAERDLLQNELGISSNLMQYLTNAPSGCGLIKFGEKIIPIDSRIPKDGLMYELLNTNFHEISRKQKKLMDKEFGNGEEYFRKISERRTPGEGEEYGDP